jgi:molybdopterin molybdotransferase
MAVSPQASGVLTFERARYVVEGHASQLRPRGQELIDLLEIRSRVLAESIHADRDFPPFRRAARDGYAVRSADVQITPTTLRVVGEIKAGATCTSELAEGQAIAIMTGAAAPDGSDAIVMVEHTTRTGDRVQIMKSVSAGENIVPAGSEASAGEELLARGTRLGYAEIAAAAAVGCSRLPVYSKPKIAILATGDEVVDIDAVPGAAQIRNSNSYSLAAQVQATGGDSVILPVAPDEPVRLRELLMAGVDADLLLIAGGVSAGKYDLVEQILSEMKAEFFFTGAMIQPGKPIVFGRMPPAAASNREPKYFFGLPGNPISTMVTFELFVRPMIEALSGANPRKLLFVHAKLKAEIKTKTGLKRFLPAVLSGEFDQSQVELVRWQGSGDIASAARANCFIVVPPDRERIAAGEWVSVLLKSN